MNFFEPRNIFIGSDGSHRVPFIYMEKPAILHGVNVTADGGVSDVALVMYDEGMHRKYRSGGIETGAKKGKIGKGTIYLCRSKVMPSQTVNIVKKNGVELFINKGAAIGIYSHGQNNFSTTFCFDYVNGQEDFKHDWKNMLGHEKDEYNDDYFEDAYDFEDCKKDDSRVVRYLHKPTQ